MDFYLPKSMDFSLPFTASLRLGKWTEKHKINYILIVENVSMVVIVNSNL